MKCDVCQKTLSLGEWPWCPHGFGEKHKGFEPGFDPGLGKVVTGWGDINKECRPQLVDDHYVHIQPRDKSDAYYRELNQRREHRKEMERRGGR